jgi:hypothetical protein
MAVDTDYSSLINQMRTDTANAIFGTGQKIAGIDTSLIQQWNMLGANSAAYRKLLAAQETGEIKQNTNYQDIASDKYLNDNYDTDTGTYVRPAYVLQTPETYVMDAATETSDTLENMRRLALAAINSPDGLNQIHYDLFDQMRLAIAGSLVDQESESGGETAGETVASAGGAISDPSQLGRVEIDGKTYSFADLLGGGTASLANNPDAALAVLDRTILDIQEGRAKISGYDPAARPETTAGAE